MTRATHYPDTAIANPIADCSSDTADRLSAEIDNLRAQYFDLTATMQKHSYKSKRDQTIDMQRLGQFADLIAKLEAAHKSANAARCWLS